MQDETIIAGQQTGAFSNTEHTIERDSLADTKALFNKAKARLLNVSAWGKICGTGSAEFHLTDEAGKDVNRTAEISDHIKINIPAPGPFAGKGFDWVQIENIDYSVNKEEDVERIIITVRPSPNPTDDNDNVAHFFSSLATSNFILRRDKIRISAAVLGRNEVPNTSEAEGADKVRNSMIAATAIAGIAKLQWTMLVKGLLTDE